IKEKLAELEALLFVHGEPLSREKIAKILSLSPEELAGFIEELARRLEDESRGLCVVQSGERIQLATKPQFSGMLGKFIKEELSEELTPASLETLSLILYLGPISRSRLEYIRGVNSTFILRSLLLRGLVERAPDPAHSASFLYEASIELVRHLGVKEKSELPEYEKLRGALDAFEHQTQVPPLEQTT
ncbi:MAG: SMC-Scp complex subunit ScpB, partial [Patescibacteria group bacterium]